MAFHRGCENVSLKCFDTSGWYGFGLLFSHILAQEHSAKAKNWVFYGAFIGTHGSDGSSFFLSYPSAPQFKKDIFRLFLFDIPSLILLTHSLSSASCVYFHSPSEGHKRQKVDRGGGDGMTGTARLVGGVEWD